MSNFRLFKATGETLDLNVMNINGWLTSSRNMRLAQAPGGTQAFVIGRSTKQVTPIRLRILVDEDTETDAHNSLGAITRFARESTSLARVINGSVTEATTLLEDALQSITPEPMHLGGTTWSTLLELRPRNPANTTALVTFNDSIVTFGSVPVTWRTNA